MENVIESNYYSECRKRVSVIFYVGRVHEYYHCERDHAKHKVRNGNRQKPNCAENRKQQKSNQRAENERDWMLASDERAERKWSRSVNGLQILEKGKSVLEEVVVVDENEEKRKKCDD